MLQVDLQVSRLVRNAQEFLFPALRSWEERVLLDHGGVDYLQDDQESLPKTYGLRHLSGAGLRLALQPIAPGLAWNCHQLPPSPGASQQCCNHREQQLGCSGSSSSANTLLFARPGSLLLLFQRPLLNIMAHLEFRKAALQKCGVCCFSRDVHYLSLISLLAKAVLSTPWS